MGESLTKRVFTKGRSSTKCRTSVGPSLFSFSAVTLNYRFTDNNGYTGVMYYRLKQTDLDDKSYYSLIKAVSGANESAVSVLVWPNPGKGQFSVKINGNTGDKEVMITDLQGKVIRRIILTGSQQTNVGGLSAGTYVITISIDLFVILIINFGDYTLLPGIEY